jgi:hypothetical protein
MQGRTWCNGYARIWFVNSGNFFFLKAEQGRGSMTYDGEEYYTLVCPEGHGKAELTLYLRDHPKSGNIDRRVVVEVDCDIRDSLLKEGRECNLDCRKTEEYLDF